MINILLLSTVISSQVVYTPMKSEVYNFLDMASVKSIISLDDEARPFSRKYIAGKLAEIESKSKSLNKLELEELDWFKREFAYELGELKNQRWFPYSYSDSVFSVKFSPAVGYGISRTGKSKGHTKWPGFYIFGSYGEGFAASASYMDIGELGDNVNKEKTVSSQTGSYNKYVSNGIEHSDFRGSISVSWKWGSVSLIKDYNRWGHGSFGNIFISDKAPSYPHIKLELKPAGWIRFNYMHGWLNSLVPDSNSFYYVSTNSIKPFVREKYINKYIAANMLTLSPKSWLDISLGNSYVYSGELRPETLIPFLYYKVMDHNLGREGLDDGNGQIFLDAKVNYFPKYSFYSSLLIDVLEIRQILKNNWYTSWFAYTLGMKAADLFTDNLSATVEYTKTNPWVYENNDEVTSYKHLGYSLGHWIGQNADQLRIQLNYRILRGLRVSTYWERIRKGGMKDIYYAYNERSNLEFLYGLQKKDYYWGIEAKYEPIYDLLIQGYYYYSDITDQDKSRTPAYQIGAKHNAGLTVSYGIL